MAKSYVLSESDRKTLSRMLSWWRGGGPGKSSRPTPTRRRNYSGGGSAPAAAQRALIYGTVPAAQYDAAAQEITPGQSSAAIALVMKWNDAGDKMVRDDDIEPAVCRNVTSYSQVMGTPSDPIAMLGTLEEVGGTSYFVLAPFDLYTLDGNELGAAPSGPDDPGLKVPYKSGGVRSYSVETLPCDGT